MKMKLMLAIACAGPVLWSGPSHAAATFKCAKDAHEIELLVCKTESLQKLDVQMNDVYKKALAVSSKMPDKGQDAKLLKAYQRGWIGERNDCWKEQDQLACATNSYTRRISGLQAQFMLVKAAAPVSYACKDNPADEIIFTAMETTPPTARLEHGDESIIAWQTPADTGTRYEGDFANVFWIKGDGAEVAWPQDVSFTCKVRK